MPKYAVLTLMMFFVATGFCHADIQYIQDLGKQQSDSFTGSTGVTGSFGTLPKAGDHIIITASGFRTAGFLLSTPTDNQGNIYHKDASTQDAGPTSEASISSAKVSASSGTFTITIKATGSGNAITWDATEYSGLAVSNWFDRKGTAQVTSTSGGTVTANGSNVQSGELVVAAVGSNSAASNDAFSNPSGGTGTWHELYVENNGSVHSAGESGYKIINVMETSAATWTWTLGSGENTALVVGTYKAAPIAKHTFILSGQSANKVQIILGGTPGKKYKYIFK